MRVLTVIQRNGGDRSTVMIEEYKNLTAARKSWDGNVGENDVLLQADMDDVVVSTGITKTVAQIGDDRTDSLRMAGLE